VSGEGWAVIGVLPGPCPLTNGSRFETVREGLTCREAAELAAKLSEPISRDGEGTGRPHMVRRPKNMQRLEIITITPPPRKRRGRKPKQHDVVEQLSERATAALEARALEYLRERHTARQPYNHYPHTIEALNCERHHLPYPRWAELVRRVAEGKS
jgi:hypothetical protein